MKLKPLGNRLVAQPIEDDEQTSSGIFLPETAKEKPQRGTVIAVGPGERSDEGERLPIDVKVDDTIIFAKYAGTEVKIDGKKYLILKETDVLAVVESA
ncbi:MAG: co-chaperone GroES [Caldilineaceae bacterium]|jgi:chaperonin GroES